MAKTVNQPNALLTFQGEQDVYWFGKVMEAVNDADEDNSGGSREMMIKAVGDQIIVGYKQEMKV